MFGVDDGHGGDLASVPPRGSYYYSGSGSLLEVVGSHVTWQTLNFADWQIYAGAGNGNLTLNHDCVRLLRHGNAQQYIINEAVGDTGMTIENSTIFSTSTRPTCRPTGSPPASARC